MLLFNLICIGFYLISFIFVLISFILREFTLFVWCIYLFIYLFFVKNDALHTALPRRAVLPHPRRCDSLRVHGQRGDILR